MSQEIMRLVLIASNSGKQLATTPNGVVSDINGRQRSCSVSTEEDVEVVTVKQSGGGAAEEGKQIDPSVLNQVGTVKTEKKSISDTNNRVRSSKEGLPLMKRFKSMIRRNSDTSDHEMGHSLILEEYESVILNVDSDSPVMYVGQESNSAAERNDDHSFNILICLMIFFLPLGGFIPLIYILLARKNRNSKKLYKKAIQWGHGILIFVTVLVILTVITTVVPVIQHYNNR